MTAWPASLPQSPLMSGYAEQGGEQALRTQMDVGPAKLRKRATAIPASVKFSMIMTATQLATLETFYDSTLNGGTGVIDFTDPINGGTKQYRYLNRHTVNSVSDTLYQVDFNWEKLP